MVSELELRTASLPNGPARRRRSAAPPPLDRLPGCLAEDEAWRLARRLPLERGQPVPAEGASLEDLWVVAEGAVMLQTVLPDGRRQVTGFRFSGDLLYPLLNGSKAHSSAETLTRCELYHLHRDDFELMSQERPELVDLMKRLICEQLTQAQAHILLLGRFTALERIASFLLKMASRTGCDDLDGLEIHLPMSREDIADYLGLNPETVSRNLTRLRKDGILDLPRPGQALLRDPGALAAMTPLGMPAAEAFAASKNGGARRDTPYIGR